MSNDTDTTNKLFRLSHTTANQLLPGPSNWYEDPYKIIKSSIQIADKISDKNNEINEIRSMWTTDLISQTRINAIDSYISALKDKNESKMIQLFEEKVDEFNESTQKVITKSRKENEQYIEQFSQIKKDNLDLREQLAKMEIEYKNKEQELIDSQNVIKQLQLEFIIFEENKPLFDAFINEFPDQTPVEVMALLMQRKSRGLSLMQDKNFFENKLRNLNKEKINSEKQYTRYINNLTEKIQQIKNEFKSQDKDLENEIFRLNVSLESVRRDKEENVFLNEMLYNIYTQLINELKLDRSVKIDKKYLNVSLKDFNARVFDDNNINLYIKEMLEHNKELNSIDRQQLKETLALMNMMIRKYLQDNSDFRYDPINSFKELKSIVDSKEGIIDRLSDKNKILQNENNRLNLGMKQLESEVIHLRKQLTNKNKTIAVMKRKNVKSKKSNLRELKETISSKFKEIKDTNQSKCVLGNEEKEKSIKKSNTQNNIMNPINYTNSNIYTNVNFNTLKNNTNAYSSKNMMTNNLTKSNLNGRIDIRKVYRETFQQPNKSEQKHKGRCGSAFDILTNISSTKLKVMSEDQAKQFRFINESKNCDKLIKPHGFQKTLTSMNDYKNLVDHANRLYVYKSKIADKHNVFVRTTKSNRLFSAHLYPKCSKRIIKSEVPDSATVEEKEIKKNIYSNIDGILKSLEDKNKYLFE